MTSAKLTPDQEKIVKSDAEAILVLASAGSGKTHVLTERVRFLLERKKRIHVLALTFTNKAAEEMRTRLNESIQNIRDRAFIGTIHSFCLEMIRNKGHLIGYSEMPHIFERESDRKLIVTQVIEGSKKLLAQFRSKDNAAQSKFIYDALYQIGLRKKYLTGIFKDQESSELWDYVYREYNALLDSQNAIDFDEIIVLAHRILTGNLNVADIYRRQYRYILVDEAQDLNFAQYELIKALCGSEHRRVMMVGDPNQAIYGFNGSDKKYMTKFFPKDFAATTLQLKENFRSSKAILHAANRLIHDSNNILVNTSLEGECLVQSFPNQSEESQWITEKISYLVDNGHPDILGKITYDRIAVLARTKYVFPPLIEELDRNEVSHYVKKTADSTEFESQFIKLFDLGLRLLVNSSDQIHFLQFVENLDLPKDCLDRLLSLPTFHERLNFIERQISDSFEKIWFCKLHRALLQIDNNVNSFSSALDELRSFWESKKENETDAAVLFDLEEISNMWNNYSKQISTGLRALSHFRAQVALGTTQANKPQSGVTLGTIHSVKGLGFDVVFIMGMNEGTFPDFRALKSTDALHEEKNNAYVALTRAKRLLYITYPLSKRMPWNGDQVQHASRFVKMITEER